MNLTEVLKLTTAGYKPAQIRELSELEKENPGAIQIAATGATLDEVKDLLTLTASGEGESPEEAAQGPAESEPGPDYKALYEELRTKAESLEATLKQIQGENSRKNVAGEPAQDPDAVLSEIVSKFM